jgi:hypothetical protein
MEECTDGSHPHLSVALGDLGINALWHEGLQVDVHLISGAILASSQDVLLHRAVGLQTKTSCHTAIACAM